MLLGIDWGEKKIGLAIADEEITIASAFEILENNKDIFVNLHKIVKENDINKIVIGKSAHVSQSDNTKLIEQFGERCRDYINIEVVFVPEMFSTHEAHMNLKSVGKKKIDSIDDAESARIILQTFLDK